MLAKDLGIHCYENRILTLASQMSGLDEKLFLDINERIRNNGGFTGFLRGLPRSRQYIARNEKFVSDDRLFEYQSQIIRNLADQESCVIVGRQADKVLAGYENCTKIFVYAPLDKRVETIMERHSLTEPEARKLIRRMDKIRRNYYSYFSDGEWDSKDGKDLMIDSSFLGVDKTVEYLAELIRMKYGSDE